MTEESCPYDIRMKATNFMIRNQPLPSKYREIEPDLEKVLGVEATNLHILSLNRLFHDIRRGKSGQLVKVKDYVCHCGSKFSRQWTLQRHRVRCM